MSGEGPSPRKSLGQHFLRDDEVLEEIVDAASLRPSDRVLEIGAGDGTLTELLAEEADTVVALETDPRWVRRLRRLFPAGGKVRVVEADALRFDLEEIGAPAPLKCVSNLPYNIAAAILDRLLAARGLFSLHLLMFQKEVALRLVARPGSRAYGKLTLFTGYRAEAQLLFTVPPHAFSPPPKVDSAVVRLLPRPLPLLDAEAERLFTRLVRGGFSHRRKTFLNAISHSRPPAPLPLLSSLLADLGHGERTRAEDLGLEDYLRLATRIAGDQDPPPLGPEG